MTPANPVRRPWALGVLGAWLAFLAAELPPWLWWPIIAVIAARVAWAAWMAPARAVLRHVEAELATVPRHHPVCPHDAAVEVRRIAVPAVGVADDVVAWWCPACETRLDPDWKVAAARAQFLAAQRAGMAPSVLKPPPASGSFGLWQPTRRLETREQIWAAGYQAIEVMAVGDRDRRWVRGLPMPDALSDERPLS